MDSVLQLRAVVATLGRFPVLAGIDLDVDRCERLLIQGPNGAGKTSLLRLCAGLIAVTSGTAQVLGCDLVAARKSVRPLVGMMGHATGLYDDLTPTENIDFWASAARVDSAGAAAAMDRVGLAARLRTVPVSRLSTGQRRRASLAAMIVRRPQLWLLDEPHAGLDGEGRALIDGLIVEASTSGATVLFASHDLDRATEVATRTITVTGGMVTSDVTNKAHGALREGNSNAS